MPIMKWDKPGRPPDVADLLVPNPMTVSATAGRTLAQLTRDLRRGNSIPPVGNVIDDLLEAFGRSRPTGGPITVDNEVNVIPQIRRTAAMWLNDKLNSPQQSPSELQAQLMKRATSGMEPPDVVP
jgi:hypothetical protein